MPSSLTGPEIMVDQNACEGISFLCSSTNLDEEAERAPAATLGITGVLPLPSPLTTSEERFEKILAAHWINSQDLAYSIVNIASPGDDESLFEGFASYMKACRLADTGHGSRPGADERFDRLAWCLGKMQFSKIDHCLRTFVLELSCLNLRRNNKESHAEVDYAEILQVPVVSLESPASRARSNARYMPSLV